MKLCYISFEHRTYTDAGTCDSGAFWTTSCGCYIRKSISVKKQETQSMYRQFLGYIIC